MNELEDREANGRIIRKWCGLYQMMGLAIRGIHTVGPSGSGAVTSTYMSMDCEPGTSVGIAIDYGLNGPGIESRWRPNFPPVQTGRGAHPASCTIGTGSFPGVK